MSKLLFRVHVESPEMSEIVQLIAFKHGYDWVLSDKTVLNTDKTCLGFWNDNDITYSLYDAAVNDDTVPLLNVIDAIKVLTQQETLESLKNKMWPKSLANGEAWADKDGTVNHRGKYISKDDMMKLCKEYLQLFPKE